jgi:hypothetical protein
MRNLASTTTVHRKRLSGTTIIDWASQRNVHHIAATNSVTWLRLRFSAKQSVHAGELGHWRCHCSNFWLPTGGHTCLNPWPLVNAPEILVNWAIYTSTLTRDRLCWLVFGKLKPKIGYRRIVPERVTIARAERAYKEQGDRAKPKLAGSEAKAKDERASPRVWRLPQTVRPLPVPRACRVPVTSSRCGRLRGSWRGSTAPGRPNWENAAAAGEWIPIAEQAARCFASSRSRRSKLGPQPSPLQVRFDLLSDRSCCAYDLTCPMCIRLVSAPWDAHGLIWCTEYKYGMYMVVRVAAFSSDIIKMQL